MLFSLWKEKLSKVACDSGGWLAGSLETSLGYMLTVSTKKNKIVIHTTAWVNLEAIMNPVIKQPKMKTRVKRGSGALVKSTVFVLQDERILEINLPLASIPSAAEFTYG